ncbi:MAG: aldo/keto reductase [Planctomycetaceae bacterium]|nr:aldo/keto reductase [Planctomycetaceae bacterium]
MFGPSSAMPFRPLGRTGISVSAIAFGCGPISNLMTGADRDRQCAVLRHAIERGVNWIDTAATYGQGRSEESLGDALRELAAHDRVHLATKVRLMPEDLNDIPSAIRRSVDGSLARLGVRRVTLLQLHNAVTAERGQEATSVSPSDVLGSRGVLESFRRLQDEGLIGHVGITAIGQAAALREVVGSGQFDTIQVPYNVMNPSAGREMPAEYQEANYGNVIGLAQQNEMGVFAIRVFAAGAVLGLPPAEHTINSPFFTLDLYRRDEQRAARMRDIVGGRDPLKEAAIRYTLQHSGVTAALIGFGDPAHVDEAIISATRGPLSRDLFESLNAIAEDRA